MGHFSVESQLTGHRLPPPRMNETWLSSPAFNAGEGRKLSLFSKLSQNPLTQLTWDKNGKNVLAAEGSGQARTFGTNGIINRHLNRNRDDYFSQTCFSTDGYDDDIIIAAGRGKCIMIHKGYYSQARYDELIICDSKYYFTDITQSALQKNMIFFSVSHEGDGRNKLEGWDLEKKCRVWQQDVEVTFKFRWSPDGSILAVPYFDNRDFALFRLDGTEIHIPGFAQRTYRTQYEDNRPSLFTWHPSGKYFATMINHSEIGIFSVNSVELLFSLNIKELKFPSFLKT